MRFNLVIIKATILVLIGVSSCQINNSSNGPEKQISNLKFADTKLNDVLSNTRSDIQVFEISGKMDTTVTGAKGTKVYIPAGTFQNSLDKTVENEIKIELIEAYSMKDFYSNNLQTISDQGFLQSGGMFYLNASKGDENLKIRTGTELFIETPTDSFNYEMAVFEGSFNKDLLVWNKVKEIESPYLIAIPFKELDFEEIVMETKYSREQLSRLVNEMNSNTFIATREFRERLTTLLPLTIGKNNNFDTLGSESLDGTIDDQILDMYIKNSNGNLSEADAKVYTFIKKSCRKFLETNFEDPLSEEYWIKMYVTEICKKYEEFCGQKLTKPLDLNRYNVKFSDPTSSIDNLNISEEEKYKLRKYLSDREKILNGMKSENELKEAVNYSFSVSKLGWINVDCFFETGEYSDFVVDVEKPNSTIDLLQVSLIIPTKKMALSANKTESGYCFTEKGNPNYSRLPVNEKAFIVVLGNSDDKYFFSIREIKIPKGGVEKIQLKETSLGAIKNELQKLG